MIETKRDYWEQQKRDVLYFLSVGDEERAREEIEKLIGYTHSRFYGIKRDEPLEKYK